MAMPPTMSRPASMKVPTKKQGNGRSVTEARGSLNKSPSKNGKEMVLPCSGHSYVATSMKVPSNRRGNRKRASFSPSVSQPLNESPSEKEGKYHCGGLATAAAASASMKVSVRKRRNCCFQGLSHPHARASMKALPTRKGNKTAAGLTLRDKPGLNESPPEKEGKSRTSP